MGLYDATPTFDDTVPYDHRAWVVSVMLHGDIKSLLSMINCNLILLRINFSVISVEL